MAAIENYRWDSATKEELLSAFNSATPGDLGPGSSRGMVAKVSEKSGVTTYTLVGPPPMTFAFQTSKGDFGIIQVVRYTEEPKGMRIRYKMAQMSAVSPRADMQSLQDQWRVVRVEQGKNAHQAWGEICGFGLPELNPATTNRIAFYPGYELCIRRFGPEPVGFSDYREFVHTGFMPPWLVQGFDYRIDPAPRQKR